MTRAHGKWGIGVLFAVALGCGDGTSGPDPVFPEDYASTYTEVRDCRANGGSHDFNRIRVLAGPSALAPYRDREEPFPVGSVVLKEEYDPNDLDCAGEIVQWSAMERLPEGNEDTLSWRWQQVDVSGTVMSENSERCIGCHAGCAPPDGYENTCTVP